MPAPWVAGAQARIVGNLHGQVTNNVMHFATNDQINDQGSLDAILLALTQAIADCVVEFLLPAVTSEWRFVQADAKRIYPAFSDPIITTGLPEHVGELGPSSVSFCASLVNIRTGVDGKKGRGRIFLPPPGEPQVAQSTIDGPTLVLLAAFTACVGAKFMGANPETPWHLGVLSQKDYQGIFGNFDNSFRVATSLNVRANMAKIGSRQVGQGV